MLCGRRKSRPQVAFARVADPAIELTRNFSGKWWLLYQVGTEEIGLRKHFAPPYMQFGSQIESFEAIEVVSGRGFRV